MVIKISIEYPRPLTVLVLAIMAGAILWTQGAKAPAIQASATSVKHHNSGCQLSTVNCQLPDPVGGPGALYYAGLTQKAEGDIRRLRIEQELLSRQEEVLRFELRILEEEEKRYGTAQVEEFRRARERLTALLHDRSRAEREILASLRQLWSVRGRASEFARTMHGQFPVLHWPVEPRYGVSALFYDQAYERRFGIPHTGVDIPIEQGTIVRAAHDGTVVDRVDNGLGFNALTIQHTDGLVTFYGHVSRFLVTPGEVVKAGDPIALSGGRPGTPGAGALTTGPHLHFEVMANGRNEDPIAFLPMRLTVAAQE